MRADRRSSKKELRSRRTGRKPAAGTPAKPKNRSSRGEGRKSSPAAKPPRAVGKAGARQRTGGPSRSLPSRPNTRGSTEKRSLFAAPPLAASALRLREMESRIRELENELAAARLASLSTLSPPRSDRRNARIDEEAGEEAAPARASGPGADALLYEDYDEQEDFLGTSSAMDSRRREIDRERADREMELGEEPFWMVCPKCGEHLSEHEYDNIRIEHCNNCAGFWLDRAESELLLLFSEEDRALAFRVRGLLH